MKIILRLTLCFLLLIFSWLQSCDWLSEEGQRLNMLGNLPHRGLGMIYAAHFLQPWREDYARSYITEWWLADSEERMMEGQLRPVVPMLTVRMANEFPFNRDLQILRMVMIQNASKVIKEKRVEEKGNEK